MANNLKALMSKKMIACDEAGYLISLRQDRSLGMKRWMQLQMHLITCHLCRKYARQISQINRLTGKYRDTPDQEETRLHLPGDKIESMKRSIDDHLNVK